MKTGFNLLLWTAHVTNDYFQIFEKLKATGYDSVEIPLFAGDPGHYRQVAAAIRDNGLACTTVTVIPDQQHNPLSPEAPHRAAAVDHLKWAIDCSAAAGSSLLCGPYHQPLGEFSGAGPTEEEEQRAADVHRVAAGYAQEQGVHMCIEYLNRFECYFINTMADAAAHVKRVGHANFHTMYDTFHANIEEKDPVGTIEPHIDVIKHVHISENDRGTPGKGHVPFAATFQALHRAGYDGFVTIESFGRALPDLAAATRVWRDFSPSPDEVVMEGYRLLRSLIDAGE